MLMEAIGYLAAILTTAAFLPQAIKTIKTGDTKSLSLTMYSVFCVGVALWLVYGISLENAPMTLANVVTLILAGTIWTMKFRNRKTDRAG